MGLTSVVRADESERYALAIQSKAQVFNRVQRAYLVVVDEERDGVDVPAELKRMQIDRMTRGRWAYQQDVVGAKRLREALSPSYDSPLDVIPDELPQYTTEDVRLFAVALMLLLSGLIASAASFLIYAPVVAFLAVTSLLIGSWLGYGTLSRTKSRYEERILG